MENEVYLTILFYYYGKLLTEKQQRYFSYYYFDNLSLGEIKDNLYNITSGYSKFLKEKFPDIWNECLSENK